jgi:2,4-dichlorophenol 6-monooxygenase
VVQGAQCVRLSACDGGVSARVRLEDGSEADVEAAWAIAADGAGSPTRRALGIDMEGPGPLGRVCMVHFEADLTPWLAERPGPIYWILNPDSPGALIVHHPRRSHVFMLPQQAAEGDPEPDVEARLARALEVPVAPKILSVDRWSPHVQVASRYREGCTFLVGDAAHRFPPTGGLGLNTGILEARELAVRLARVEAGEPEDLLDEYERICRPVAWANADESFENLKRMAEISRVLGEWTDRAGLEPRVARLTDSERGQLDKAIDAQLSHFLSDGSFPGTADDRGLEAV